MSLEIITGRTPRRKRLKEMDEYVFILLMCINEWDNWALLTKCMEKNKRNVLRNELIRDASVLPYRELLHFSSSQFYLTACMLFFKSPVFEIRTLTFGCTAV